MYNKNALLIRKIREYVQVHEYEYGQLVVKLFNRETNYYFNIVVEYYPRFDGKAVYQCVDILEHETSEFYGNYVILDIVDLQSVL